MSTSPDDLLNASEVAAEFGLHAVSIRRRIKAGEIPAVKVGNAFKIRRSDLDGLATPVCSDDPELDRAVSRVLAGAPALTSEQRERLGRLLSPSI